jgi:N-acetylglucosamine-6-phosphate deacetylase
MNDSENAVETLSLRGARLVLPDRLTDNASSLLIKEGRIQSLDEGEQTIPQHTHTLEGLTLFPGFIDVHLHGSVGIDTMEASWEELHRVARFLAQNGVTGWLPTLVPAPVEDYNRAAHAIGRLMSEQDSGRTDAAARALGLHYEGPFINSAQCGALRSQYFRHYEDAADIDALALPENSEVRRMITVAPEIEGGIELIKELVRRGWIVSIGHTRAPIELLNHACVAGARHMTHFMNAMSPLHHRAPGPIGWGLLRDDVSCDVIADGVHLDSMMLELLLRVKTPERLALISDAVAPTGLGDGEYNIWNETISVVEGRTQNARGNIAGSVITMLDAVRTMLALDCSPNDVAQMASSNPARLLGLSKEYGSIEVGKRADLVALDAEGNVRLTLIGGRIAFENLE